jgi:hypothetical protein
MGVLAIVLVWHDDLRLVARDDISAAHPCFSPSFTLQGFDFTPLFGGNSSIGLAGWIYRSHSAKFFYLLLSQLGGTGRSAMKPQDVVNQTAT